MKVFYPSGVHKRPILCKVRDEESGELVEKDSGATIDIGFIPHAIMARLRSSIAPHLRAMDEVHERVTAEGRAEQPFREDEVKVFEAADVALDFHGEELVRYGVRGHTGFELEDGTQAPFVATEEDLDGRKIPTVGAETMELYRANRLFRLLVPLVREVQTLPETARRK